MANRYSQILIAALLGCCPVLLAQSSAGTPGGDAQRIVDCGDPSNAAMAACQGGGQQYPGGDYPQGNGWRNVDSSRGSAQNGITYQDNGGRVRSQMGMAYPAVPPASPEPLTEFQKLVAATTDEVLPIFGHELFRGVPSTFAPVDQIPVTPDYVVGPGDEVRIRVWGQVNLSADLTVDRSGNLYLPQVGRIQVTGLHFSDLSQHLRSQMARVYRNFDLTVDLGQLRSIQIFVVGHARRPGAYTVSSLSTLVNALFASGGPSAQGTMRDIQVKRNGSVISHFDLYDLLIRGDTSRDARLLPGDVIFIPAVGPQVALTGSIRKPAIYELNPGELNPSDLGRAELFGGESTTTIRQLLDSGGGLSTVASGSRISIERIEDRQMREAIEVPVDVAGLATLVRDGDLVRILSIIPAFEKTVTLRGNLANPGRFGWHPGMKLSDLIPDRPSLITRNYWWRRAQLGLPGAEFQPLEGRGPLVQPPHPSYLPKRQKPMNGATGSEISLDPQDTQNPNLPDRESPTGAGLDLRDSDSQYSNDNTAGPGGRTAAQSAQAETGGSTLAGQQSQVITQNVAAAAGRVDIRLSAPEIDWAYAVIERLNPDTLKTSLLPFNLGRLVIDHDPTQDLPLQAGDVVTIFSQADIKVPIEQQTKFVRLEGEFVSAGIYSVGPGETLRQLVQRAGGFAPGAYLFGSEFTRESTRVFQQQRLDEYVQSLEMQIQRSGMNLAASAVNAQDVASANAASINQQGLLNKLRQLRATGRIVLEVKPNSNGVESIPDLPLQDDDRFVVPSTPASVNVVGAVYDQSSFIYRHDSRVGDYLRLAGGPNREADKRHIFIIRADGSVYSRETANGLWGNNFEAVRLTPGDSIIVPEKVIGPSFVRNFINWSQVFSQLALGAAAINVL
jgi:protein involved in polysaccharide export with SLBB domain